MVSHSPFYFMEEPVPIRCYKSLACAIIGQAVRDYLYSTYPEQSLYNFLYHTQWIQYLDLDIDYLWKIVTEKKRRLEYESKQKMDSKRNSAVDS